MKKYCNDVYFIVIVVFTSCGSKTDQRPKAEEFLRIRLSKSCRMHLL